MIHSTLAESAQADAGGLLDTGTIMNDNHTLQRARQALVQALGSFHRDDAGVAMTEYIIVFTLISFGSTVALLGTAVYVKAYRDFMVWWLGHPAV